MVNWQRGTFASIVSKGQIFFTDLVSNSAMMTAADVDGRRCANGTFETSSSARPHLRLHGFAGTYIHGADQSVMIEWGAGQRGQGLRRSQSRSSVWRPSVVINYSSRAGSLTSTRYCRRALRGVVIVSRPRNGDNREKAWESLESLGLSGICGR